MDHRENPARATQVFPKQELLTGKVTAAMEMPQQFMMPMCEHRDILLAHTTKKRLGILVASDGPVTKNLPSSVAAYTFFMRKDFLDRNFRRTLLVSVSSPLVSDVSTLRGLWDKPCFSLSSASFSSVNIKTYIVHQTRKLFTPNEAENTN